MTTRPSPLFTAVFVLVALLEMLGETLPDRWLHYGTKPLIMLLLLAYGWRASRSATWPGYVHWLLTGMVFALLGDMFLMIREVDLFVPGLGAFLLMQVCYSVSFRQSMRRYGQPSSGWRLWLPALAFVLYLTGFLSVLRPAFAHNPELRALWWPVVIYAVCLNTMGLLAVLRRGLPGYGWVVTGALLFILSDSAIAVNKFLFPIRGASWLIMSTYAAAQYLIVIGTVKYVVVTGQPSRIRNHHL